MKKTPQSSENIGLSLIFGQKMHLEVTEITNEITYLILLSLCMEILSVDKEAEIQFPKFLVHI